MVPTTMLLPQSMTVGAPVALPRVSLAASPRCTTHWREGLLVATSYRKHDTRANCTVPSSSGSPQQPTLPSAVPGPATEQQQQQQQPEDSFQGLPLDEDQQVPGGYEEAMNGNTRLGKAVRAACSELQHLNKMEASNLQEAEKLLKMLGVKTPLVSQEQQQAVADQFAKADGEEEGDS